MAKRSRKHHFSVEPDLNCHNGGGVGALGERERPATDNVSLTILEYIDQIFNDAEALNHKLCDLLSNCNGGDYLSSEDNYHHAWGKMSGAVSELIKNAAAIAAITSPPPPPPPPKTPQDTSSSPAPPMAAAASPPLRYATYSSGPAATTTTKRVYDEGTPAPPSHKKRKPSEPLSSPPPPSPSAGGGSTAPSSRCVHDEGPLPTPLSKKRKVEEVPADEGNFVHIPCTKRRFSGVSENGRGDVKKRKRTHRDGTERPMGSERKRKAGEDFPAYREGVGLKKGRTGYFQDGDPPMEYEEVSDDGDDDEVEEGPAGEGPVSVSSEGGEL